MMKNSLLPAAGSLTLAFVLVGAAMGQHAWSLSGDNTPASLAALRGTYPPATNYAQSVPRQELPYASQPYQPSPSYRPSSGPRYTDVPTALPPTQPSYASSREMLQNPYEMDYVAEPPRPSSPYGYSDPQPAYPPVAHYSQPVYSHSVPATPTVFPRARYAMPYTSAPEPETIQPQVMQGGMDFGKVGDVDCAFGYCPPARCTQWMLTADALVMARSAGNSYPLIRTPVATNAPPLTYRETVLDTAGIDHSAGFGMRASIARMSMTGWGVELGFMGIVDGWDYNETISGVLELNGPGFQVGSNPDLTPPTPVAFQISSESEFYSVDLNALHGLCDWATIRAGIRWIDFDECLRVDELYTPLSGLLCAHADNNLIGPQIGTDLKLLDWHCRFRINAKANFGLLYNDASFYASSCNFGPPLVASGDELTVMGELGLEAKYRLTEHVAIRGGYQALGLHGVVMAGEQLAYGDITTELTALKTGSLFAHGGSFGLEVFW